MVWWLRTEGDGEVKVLLLTAFPDRVLAVRADYGYYDHASERYDLPVPVEGLRPA